MDCSRGLAGLSNQRRSRGNADDAALGLRGKMQNENFARCSVGAGHLRMIFD